MLLALVFASCSFAPSPQSVTPASIAPAVEIVAAPQQEKSVAVAIVNAAPYERVREWCSIVGPFDHAPEGIGVLEPFGWPVVIGSRVGARGVWLHVLVERIGPTERLEGKVTKPGAGRSAQAPRPPPGEPVLSGGPADPLPSIIVTVDEVEHRWRPSTLDVLDEDLSRIVFHASGRIPGTLLVVHAWFSLYPGWQRSVPFEIFIANCDPRTTETVQPYDDISIEIARGAYPAVDFLRARGGGNERALENGRDRITLTADSWLGHGQGLGFVGRLVYWREARQDEWSTLAGATDSPLHGIAVWGDTWGLWSAAPELHPSEATESRGHGHVATRALWDRFVRELRVPGTVWNHPTLRYHGLNDFPGDTGAQGDFGVYGLPEAILPEGGDPLMLWRAWPALLRDASRPSFYYHEDAAPADLARPELAKWATWGFSTHYHPGPSPYQWGKREWSPKPSNVVLHKDFAHASSNFLAAHAVLSGSYLARHVCAQEMTDLLAFGRDFGLGEDRAWGRCALVAAWHYLATGDRERVDRFRQAIETNPALFGSLLAAAERGWEVRIRGGPIQDGRKFDGRVPYWKPWQQGLQIAGLDALAQVSPSPKMDEILFHLCRTHIAYAWWLHKGRWTVADALHWLEDGRALNPAQYSDLNHALPHWPGTDFDVWCHAAVRVAARRLAAKEPVLAQKARTIDDALVERWRTGTPRAFGDGSRWFGGVR